MGGFTRELAAKALGLGWSQAEVSAFQIHLKNAGVGVVKVFDWGLLTSDDVVQYRTISLHVTRSRCFNTTAHSEATIYTDGSGNTGEKPAGIGVYIQDGWDRLFVAEHIGLGTNNRAELCAIWRGLRQFPWVQKPLHILSDSEYAIGVLTNDWVLNANGGLIRRIREDLALREGKVRFDHVDGHSGIEGNEIADQLAKIGRKTITAVTEYEG